MEATQPYLPLLLRLWESTRATLPASGIRQNTGYREPFEESELKLSLELCVVGTEVVELLGQGSDTVGRRREVKSQQKRQTGIRANLNLTCIHSISNLLLPEFHSSTTTAYTPD